MPENVAGSRAVASVARDKAGKTGSQAGSPKISRSEAATIAS